MFNVAMNNNASNGGLLIANNHADYVQPNKAEARKKIIVNGNSIINNKNNSLNQFQKNIE